MPMAHTTQITGLKWVTRYYIIMCFGPLPTSLIMGVYLRTVLVSLFIITRLFGLSKVIYELLLCFGAFEDIHGPLDTFGYLEATLWGCGMLPYVACDILLLNPEFLRNVDKCFKEMKQIHENTKLAEKSTGGHSAAHKSIRFMLFSCGLDWFQNIFTFVAMQGAMTDKCFVYSVLPWKSPFLENFFWFLESFNLAVLFNVISMMTTLPGVWAYYLEETLNRMTDAVVEESGALLSKEEFKDSGTVQRMIEHYRNLLFITRELNKCIGWGVMSFNTTNSVQQTAETYVIFQLLKMGASFDDVQFLFTDITISASRVAHCFHAMGVVHGSAQEFLSAIKAYMSQRLSNCPVAKRSRKYGYDTRFVRSQVKSFKDIQMTIGKTKCGSDFLLEGMSVYSDNYFTAALWP